MTPEQQEPFLKEQARLIKEIQNLTDHLSRINSMLLDTPADAQAPAKVKHWGPDPNYVAPKGPTAESRQLDSHTVTWDAIGKV